MTAVKVKTSSGWVTLSGGGIPMPVVNGQWIKGVGSVPVWSAINAADVVGAEAVANKGVANGYPSLDATGKVPAAQLPPLGALTLLKSGDAQGVSTVDISAIPATHWGLLMMATVGCPYQDGTVSFGVRVNGTADGYMWQYLRANGSTVAAGDQGATRDTSAVCGWLNGNWSYAGWAMLIPDYRNAWATTGYCWNLYMTSTGVGGIPSSTFSWNWTGYGGSQVVNRLTFLTRTGSGSFSMQNWRLYGLL